MVIAYPISMSALWVVFIIGLNANILAENLIKSHKITEFSQ